MCPKTYFKWGFNLLDYFLLQTIDLLEDVYDFELFHWLNKINTDNNAKIFFKTNKLIKLSE